MIYALGETIFDIIFRNGVIMAGRVGGSMTNASISLGRMGYPVSLITQVGNDDLGQWIRNFLFANGVRIDYIHAGDEIQTPLALAFLDENKNARYSFYRSPHKESYWQFFPQLTCGDIILFGSITAVNPRIRPAIMDFIRKASNNDIIIFYDPNIRPSHRDHFEQTRQLVIENLSISNLVRASLDDFTLLFGIRDAREIFHLVKMHSEAVLILTDGARPVRLFTHSVQLVFEVPTIEPISTIGAGDTFNAGIIASLFDGRVKPYELHKLPEDTWIHAINHAIRLSQKVCLSYDNYIDKEISEK